MSWFDTFFIPAAILYFLVLLALFIYGINFYYLAFHAWRQRGKLVAKPEYTEPGLLPTVTIQLPIYNEWYVAERLIEAAAAMDYPKHLLQIQVLDDSTDETATITASSVHRLQAQGLDIVLIQRVDRRGYKAGALEHGAERDQQEDGGEDVEDGHGRTGK